MPKIGLKSEEDSGVISMNRNGATFRMVNVRMPIELCRALEVRADAETRSVGGQVVHILKQALLPSQTCGEAAEKKGEAR